ncbi:capsular biosynthesis protein [Sporosarcina sp. ANT_H38]|uniref:tyrosine-protein phosphatase n=1 Tax=Sporosarcina sp. ANT_H38 TaxID=2597358 RepID=UPI0011F39D82|nr:CpsB/CapC family capsule biosynthesis tyrosine phosphatase [Sporosarcina sp. ANT_H38]KAA0955544.1 capsular biosynthesis protein [Sporosarcina sp. ANT_H38]
MIDMHAHILSGVDDGPETLSESLELIEVAIAEGITDIIATPHAYNPHYNVPKQVVLEKIKLLSKEIKKRDLAIQLHAGQEIRIQESTIEKLHSGEALTLANSKYVLLELPSSGIPAYTVQIIQGILNLNKVPIIAHPERNRAIAEKPSRLERLVSHGALSQVTAGSLAGHFGKSVQRLSLQLVEANLVHAYGSDVHNAVKRPFLYGKGLDFLEKHKHHDQVDILLENNARILTNEDLILLEPGIVECKKWWHLIG